MAIIYNYQCVVCDKVVEVQHKMSEKPEVLCPSCNTPMRKCIGGHTTIKFNGDWYSNKGHY